MCRWMGAAMRIGGCLRQIPVSTKSASDVRLLIGEPSIGAWPQLGATAQVGGASHLQNYPGADRGESHITS